MTEEEGSREPGPATWTGRPFRALTAADEADEPGDPTGTQVGLEGPPRRSNPFERSHALTTGRGHGDLYIDAVGQPLLLSGWWRRAAGLVIDTAVLSVPIGILGLIFLRHQLHHVLSVRPAPDWIQVLPKVDTAPLVVLVLLSAVLAVAYPVVMIGQRGQTLGMMAVGVEAVDAVSGGPLDVRQVWRRSLVAYALVGLVPLIGSLLIYTSTTSDPKGTATTCSLLGNAGAAVTYLWPVPSKLNQTLQDRAAGSVVILIER